MKLGRHHKTLLRLIKKEPQYVQGKMYDAAMELIEAGYATGKVGVDFVYKLRAAYPEEKRYVWPLRITEAGDAAV